MRALALLLTLLVSAPAFALDPTKTPPITAKSIDVGGAITCRAGTGCDVSTMTAMPAASAPEGTFARRFWRQKMLSDFGPAVGDGSDATAALTAMMAATDSPTVTIPVGTYLLSTCSTLSAASSVSIQGAGKGKAVIRLAPNLTCANDIFQWVQKSNVRVSGITIDTNGARHDGNTSTYTSVISLLNSDGAQITDSEIIGGVANRFDLIQANGGSNGRITGNTLSFPACAITQNHAVQVGNSFAPASKWIVDGNFAINSGMFFQVNRYMTATNNNIFGACYGAGIVTAQQNFITDNLIANNTIYNTGNLPDTDATVPSGIESWGFNDQITGNKIYGVGAQCVNVGGRNSTVTANSCHGWGNGFPAGTGVAAYKVHYGDATYGGSGATVSGNTSYLDGASPSETGIKIDPLIVGAKILNNSVMGSSKVYDNQGGSTVIADLANAWVSYNPTVAFADGSGVVPSNISAAYQTTGKTVSVRVSVQIAYTTAPTQMTVSLPSGMTAKGNQTGTGFNVSGSLPLIAYSLGMATITVKGSSGPFVNGQAQTVTVSFGGEIQ